MAMNDDALNDAFNLTGDTPGDHITMMTVPDLWPDQGILPLVRRENEVGVLLLGEEIGRTEVFIANCLDPRLRQEEVELDSLTYQSFQDILDDGWRVDSLGHVGVGTAHMRLWNEETCPKCKGHGRVGPETFAVCCPRCGGRRTVAS